jgi:AraC-like DNA-binding protein
MAVSTAFILSDLVLNIFVLLLLYTEDKKTKTRIYVLAIILLQIFAQFPPFLSAMVRKQEISIIALLPFRHWAFLAGPFLYFYTAACMGKPFRKILLLHLIPFFLWYVLFLVFPLGFLKTPMAKGFYGMTNVLSLVLYSIVILQDIARYQTSIKDQFSFTSIFMELSWLSSILKALLVIMFLLVLFVAIGPRFALPLPPQGMGLGVKGVDPEWVSMFHSIAILGFTLVFSFFALKQNRIAVPQGREVLEKKPLVLIPGMGEEPKAKDHDLILFSTLVSFMEKEKPYLSNSLSLQMLSEKVSIPRNELSRLINTQTKENFFQFVNGYRAREFQLAISENRYPNYTLLGIALECGFNSKATFNTAVKQKLGKTPSQVQSEHQMGMTL